MSSCDGARVSLSTGNGKNEVISCPEKPTVPSSIHTRSIERNSNEKQSAEYSLYSKSSDRNESINTIIDPNR